MDKFRYGEKVKIKTGFYRDFEGIIEDIVTYPADNAGFMVELYLVDANKQYSRKEVEFDLNEIEKV